MLEFSESEESDEWDSRTTELLSSDGESDSDSDSANPVRQRQVNLLSPWARREYFAMRARRRRAATAAAVAQRRSSLVTH